MTIIWFIQFLIPIILAVNSLNIIQAAVIPVIHIHPVNHGGQTTPTPSTQYSDKKIPAPTSIFSSDTINSIPASLTNAISNVISKNNDDINDDDLSKLDLSKMNLTQLLLENQQRLDELEKERDSLIWNSVDNDGNVDENKNPSINDNTNNGLVAKARAELLDIK